MNYLNPIRAAALALVCAATLQAADGQYNPNKRDEEDVLKLGKQWREAIVRADVAALERIEADEFTFVDPMGTVLTKAQDIALFRDGQLKFDSLDASGIKARVYIGGVVVTGTLTIKGKHGDTDLSGQYRFTDVFEKKKAGWQAVSSQVTQVKEKEPATPVKPPTP